MQIVIQGPIYEGTIDTAHYYNQLDFVEKVIISTWKPEVSLYYDNIDFVFSEPPVNEINSPCRMNWQIVSSKVGIEHTSSDIVAKMRSDQRIDHQSMIMMKDFFLHHKHNEISYTNGDGPEAPIFALGLGCCMPYHPQDHVFWGYRKDLLKLFDIPLMDGKILRVDDQFDYQLREPIYLGAHYYKHFDPNVQLHLDNFKEYLVDLAPKRQEAMDTYDKIRDKVFKVFPKINLWWEKYNMTYPYGGYAEQGEYYADSIPTNYKCVKTNTTFKRTI